MVVILFCLCEGSFPFILSQSDSQQIISLEPVEKNSLFKQTPRTPKRA